MNMTDEFVEISRPGQVFGLIEIEAIKMDSVFGYPSEEREIRSMTLISRRTGKQIAPNSYAKIYFGKKNNHYRWRIRHEVSLADFVETDTILLKPNTWYRLSREIGVYNTEYFYWTGIKGDFIVKSKPDPGAF
jgi:hypothetical protein